MNIICVGLVGLVIVLWNKCVKAEKKASRLYDICEKATEQTEKAIIAYERLEDKYKETKQRLDLYDSLLADTEIMKYRIYNILNDDIMGGYTLGKVYEDLDKIVAEYRALECGKTTGEGYDTIPEPKGQCKVVSLDEYRR